VKATSVSVRLRIFLFAFKIPNSGSTPVPDSVQASWLERLMLLAKCGACVQHDKWAVNDLSIIDTDKGTMANTTMRPCQVSVSFPHLVTSHDSIKQLDLFGNHLYLTGDRESPSFYHARQAKHRHWAYTT